MKKSILRMFLNPRLHVNSKPLMAYNSIVKLVENPMLIERPTIQCPKWSLRNRIPPTIEGLRFSLSTGERIKGNPTWLFGNNKACVLSILRVFTTRMDNDDTQKISRLNAPGFNGLEVAWKT